MPLDHAKVIFPWAAEKLAYPNAVKLDGDAVAIECGMTLREHYAGLFVQALLANGIPGGLAVTKAVKIADDLIAALCPDCRAGH